jgi:hypothetical protein
MDRPTPEAARLIHRFSAVQQGAGQWKTFLPVRAEKDWYTMPVLGNAGTILPDRRESGGRGRTRDLPQTQDEMPP